MPAKPRVTGRRLLVETRIFRVEELDLEFSNGEQRRYERLLGSEGGAVLVVPIQQAHYLMGLDPLLMSFIVVIIGVVIATIAGFLIIGLAPNLWLVGVGVGLIGGGYGSLVPVMMGFATAAGRPQFRGILVGTYVSANRVGMFAGPSLATVAAAGLGDRRTYVLGACIVALVAVGWLPLRRLANARAGVVPPSPGAPEG